MKRHCCLSLLVLLALLGTGKGSDAQVPEKHLAVAYRGWSSDGLRYRELFVPEQADTLYVLAGEPVALNAHRTLVYYWPLTGRYLADWESMDEALGGCLEISPGTRLGAGLEATSFSLVHPDEGPSTPRIGLVTGAEAEQQYARYQAEVADYQRQLDRYTQDLAAYEAQMRAAIKAVGAGQQNVPLPIAPAEPLQPKLNVTRPAGAFVFILEEGRYTIRLRGPDGEAIAGSTRQVVAFRARREGLSYTVIPGDKWTQPVRSDVPEDTLYVARDSALYFQPRAVREYRESYYLRLKDPQDSSGRDDRWLWVQQELVDSGQLELQQGARQLLSIGDRPYLVQQAEGAALGYRILEYDGKAMPDKSPTFHGYRLTLQATAAPLQLRFRDAQGKLVPGSEREVRSLNGRAERLYLPALLPLLLAGVLAVRRRAVRHRGG